MNINEVVKAIQGAIAAGKAGELIQALKDYPGACNAIEAITARPDSDARKNFLAEEMENPDVLTELERSGILFQNVSGSVSISAGGHVAGRSVTSIGNTASYSGDTVDIHSEKEVVVGKDQSRIKIYHFYREPPTESDAAPKQNITDEQSFRQAIDEYCQKAEALHEKIPLAGFTINLRVPIKIDDIYVPLRAMIDSRPTGRYCFADAEDADTQLQQTKDCLEISVPDAFKEAASRNRRGIVILGDPGSGKTTHIKRVLIWCLRGGLAELGLPKDMIPVFLPLRELKDVGTSLDDFIQTQLDQPNLKTPKGFGKCLLKRGKLLLLLDGLDEIPETAYRAKVSRWVETAMAIHKSCRFVVTCRFAGYTQETRLNENFLEMHIRHMTTEQAEKFIYNWYQIVETTHSRDSEQAKIIASEKAEMLVTKLQQPEFRARRVFEMTRNPLLLTNICLVHLSRGNLPHTRAILYKECTDVLLERWRGSVGIETRVTSQAGSRVLQPVAYWLHQKKERKRATADELSSIIEPVLKTVGWHHGTAKEFLKAVRDESGILTGWDQEHYGFMHLGFQEYLAAREIRSRAFRDLTILKELASKFGDSWWQEVILLMLALEDPSPFEPFFQEVVKLNEFKDNWNLVEMCLDDAAEKTPQPFIDLLEMEPGSDKGLWERQLAALRIVERMDKPALEKLVTSLQHHPCKKIQQWLTERAVQEKQTVIYSKRGGYELVRIPGGVFMMGTDENQIPKLIKQFGGDKEWYQYQIPQHKVHVSEFYMGRYPVTNEEYGRFLAENKGVKEPSEWGNRNFNQPKQPVIGVSWHEVKKFAEWAGLRLPSEAQWEYACRAGTTTQFYTGDTEQELDRAGWYAKNSGRQTHPVGEKEANALGLYDMHGNIWEWCEDDFHYSYNDAPDNGSPWIDSPRGALRVVRGGSWFIMAGVCRSAYRRRNSPDIRWDFIGFRLVCLPGQL